MKELCICQSFTHIARPRLPLFTNLRGEREGGLGGVVVAHENWANYRIKVSSLVG